MSRGRTTACCALALVLGVVAGCDDRSGDAAEPSVPPPDVEVADSDLRIIDLAMRTTRSIAATDRAEESPSWSPDGRTIAFHRWLSGGRRTGEADLFTVDVATGAEQVALSRPGADLAPSWSPDGSRLVFVARGPAWDVWSIEPGTGEPVQLTSGPEFEVQPEVSPDEAQLSFIRFGSNGEQTLVVQPLDATGEPVSVTAPEIAVDAYAWSPTGESIAVLGNREKELNHLWIVTVGSAAEPRELPGLTSPAGISWSPDGTRIAVTDEADGHLYLVEVQTGAVTQLSDEPTDDSEPSWSPDGEHLVYTASPNPPGAP